MSGNLENLEITENFFCVEESGKNEKPHGK